MYGKTFRPNLYLGPFGPDFLKSITTEPRKQESEKLAQLFADWEH